MIMIKEYLVEVTKRCRQWVEAYDEEEAKTLAENMEEADNSEIDNVEILDEREIENDDAYLEYLDDEEDEEIEEEW